MSLFIWIVLFYSTEACFPTKPNPKTELPVTTTTTSPSTSSPSTASSSTTTVATTTSEPLEFEGQRFALIYDHARFPLATAEFDKTKRDPIEKEFSCKHGETVVMKQSLGATLADLTQVVLFCDADEVMCVHTEKGSFRFDIKTAGNFNIFNYCEQTDKCKVLANPFGLIDSTGAPLKPEENIETRNNRKIQSDHPNLIVTKAAQCVQRVDQCSQETFKSVQPKIDVDCKRKERKQGFKLPTVEELLEKPTLTGEKCAVPPGSSVYVFISDAAQPRVKDGRCRYEEGSLKFWPYDTTAQDDVKCWYAKELCLRSKTGNFYTADRGLDGGLSLRSHCERDGTCSSVVRLLQSRKVVNIADYCDHHSRKCQETSMKTKNEKHSDGEVSSGGSRQDSAK